MINKDFCLSSYMAFRYIYLEDMDFFPGMKHKNMTPLPKSEKISVKSAQEIDREMCKTFEQIYQKYDSVGILLSGGMDSGILAAYLKPGSLAYSFTSTCSEVYDLEIQRAKRYAERAGLKFRDIPISFEDYKEFTPIVMKEKCAPVHSIEPQIYKAAIQAKEDGVDLLIVGESADLIFGGMDGLLSKDWKFDDFVQRYTFLDPQMVLNRFVDMTGLYERYRQGDGVDVLSFLDEVFSIESSSSYMNAFSSAQIPYCDPYANLTMGEKLDLNRVRNGEPKYLIRELFALKYPDLPIPDKIPMPRPVDAVFNDWKGPVRSEFKRDIPMQQLTGNQKWQLWCAELFLNCFEPKEN